MIKRYGLGAKAEKITAESVQFGLVGIVERPDGEYYKASDVDAYLESIGAGGVSGRITKKAIEERRAEFEQWATSVGYNTDKVAGVSYRHAEITRLWKAWKAAKGVKE